MSCAASAKAKPPIPRPERIVETLKPRLWTVIRTPMTTKIATRVFLIHGMNAATPICFSRATSCMWSNTAPNARSKPQKTTSENATVEP